MSLPLAPGTHLLYHSDPSSRTCAERREGKDLLRISKGSPPGLYKREHFEEAPNAIGSRVAGDDNVESVDTPNLQEVHHVHSPSELIGAPEVALAAELEEDCVTSSHIYEAHDQRTRGRRLNCL